MAKRKSEPKENLDLAKEHIKLAQDLVNSEAKKSSKNEKKFVATELSLEKAESEIDEIEDDDELEDLEVLGEDKEPAKEE